MRISRLALLGLLGALVAAPAVAQSPPRGRTIVRDSTPTPADADVLGAVRRLFDGMRAGDSTVVRSVFHPAASLMSVSVRNGQPMLRVDTVANFVRAVGTPHPVVWDERIANERVHVDGNLAVVWMDYTFYAGERLSHCGVNTFQLFKGADGWKVIALTDTRRTEGCPQLPARR